MPDQFTVLSTIGGNGVMNRPCPTQRRRPRSAILLLGLALAGGCAARQRVSDLDLLDMPSGQVAAPGILNAHDRRRLEDIARARASAPAPTGYAIGPDDLLEIRIPDLLEVAPSAALGRAPTGGAAALPQVAEAPVFQQGSRVSADGTIMLPLLGIVPVAGLTPSALELDLAQRLKSGGILRAPQVSVLVAEYRSQVVAVVGSVERPGLYPVTRAGLTLADVVLAAGGPSKDAGRVVGFVPATAAKRPTLAMPDAASAIQLDLEMLLHPPNGSAALWNPLVRAGDVISVSPAGNVMVDGWVEKPGSYPATRGLTVSGAVAAAGGTQFAADRVATVKRGLGAEDARFYRVDLAAVARGETPDLPLADGDVVHLAASPTRVVPWGLWILAREMIHIGGSVALF